MNGLNPVARNTKPQEMPRKPQLKQNRAQRANVARSALYPLHARPPNTDSGQKEVGEQSPIWKREPR